MTVTELLRLLGTFTWWGMVLAISGLEAPLKFRAPGITVAPGLGFLRPKLDRRALQLIEGETPPASRGHLVYVAIEGLKIVLLPVLGVLFWLDLPAR